MSDNGEAAIARERAEHEADEDARSRNYDPRRQAEAVAKNDAARVKRVLEEEEREAFREKLAYWRNQGAPPYHGPRAVERGATVTDFLIVLLLLAYIGFVGYWIVKNIYWAITL